MDPRACGLAPVSAKFGVRGGFVSMNRYVALPKKHLT